MPVELHIVKLQIFVLRNALKNRDSGTIANVLRGTTFVDVISEGCRVVFTLAASDARGTRKLCRLRVGDSLVHALAAFHQREDVVQDACKTIAVLSLDACNRRALCTANACVTLVNVLGTYGRKDRIAEFACAAIRNLAIEDEGATKLGLAGACEELANVLAGPGATNMRVAEQVHGAVQNLTICPSNRQKFEDMGMRDKIVQNLQQFGVENNTNISLYGSRARGLFTLALPGFEFPNFTLVDRPITLTHTPPRFDESQMQDGSVSAVVSRYMAGVALSRFESDDFDLLAYLRGTISNLLREEDLLSTRFGTISANFSPYGHRIRDAMANTSTRYAVNVSTGLPAFGVSPGDIARNYLAEMRESHNAIPILPDQPAMNNTGPIAQEQPSTRPSTTTILGANTRCSIVFRAATNGASERQEEPDAELVDTVPPQEGASKTETSVV